MYICLGAKFETMKQLVYVKKERQKRILEPIWNIFKPFPKIVWATLLVTRILAMAAASILTIHTGRESQLLVINKVYISFLAQSCWSSLDYKKSKSLTIFIISWIWFIHFIDSSYTCNLRAYMMDVDYEKQIDSANDLIDMNRIAFFPAGTDDLHLMSVSLKAEEKKLAQIAIERNLTKKFILKTGLSIDQLNMHIKGTGQAAMMVSSLAQSGFPKLVRHYGYPPFRLSKSNLYEGLQVFGVRKNVTWMEQFNLNFLRLIDAGIPIHLVRNYFPMNYLLAEYVSKRPPEPIQLAHMFAPIIILLVGISISAITFVSYEIMPHISTKSFNCKVQGFRG